MKKLNLKHLLIISMMMAGLLPMLALGIFSLNSISDQLYTQGFNHLESIRSIKKSQIEDYFGTINKQVRFLSQDRMTVDAMRGLTQEFLALSKFNTGSTSAKQARVSKYYHEDFSREFKIQNGESVNVDNLIPTGQESIVAQDLYIGNSPYPLGEKSQLNDAGDESGYSLLHSIYHPLYKSYLEKFGYYDIFLVEPSNGYIVYSVFKELDYATSLNSGPYRNTNIATVYNKALKLSDPNGVAVADFEKYLPSYNAGASFISSPIYDDETLIGVLIFQMPVGKINEIMQVSEGMGETGESYLVADDRLMRSQSRFSDENTIIKQRVDSETVQFALAGKSGANIVTDYRGSSVLSAFAPIDLPGLKWAIIAEIDEEEAFAGLVEIQYGILAVVVVSIILLLVLSFQFIRRITEPLRDAVGFCESIADGDLTARIQINREDEIGQLMLSIRSMREKLKAVVAEVQSSSNSLAAASEQVSGTAQSLSQGAREQAASVEETSASIEQMGASINQNSENAQVTDGIASESSKAAKEGGESVIATTQAMKNIAEKISIIEDIAYQTNMLALNAAIEAARAGEHGKGFAVVAAEVRKLAERSQVAASEISELTGESVKVADKAGKLLEKMVPDIAKTADLVQEINATSEEQAGGVGQISGAMQKLDRVTQQNTAASEELAATSQEMRSQAQSLLDVIAFFRLAEEQNSPPKSADIHKLPIEPISRNEPKEVAESESLLSHNADLADVEIIDESQFQRF